MLIFWFVCTIFLLILFVSKFKVHAFLTLLLAGLFFGLVAGIEPVTVAKTVTAGVGGTMTHIGIVIICGVIIGEILEITGGAQKIANAILKLVGIKRATYATSITGAFVSIPVFCDSGFVILNPIIKALSRAGKIPYATLVVALMAGLLTTHSFIPPTPGPVAAAGIFGANLGKVMLYGIMAALPVVIACSIWGNSRFIKGKYPEIAVEDSDIEKEAEFAEIVANAPSTFKSFLPILLPIALIIVASFVPVIEGDYFSQIINFLGTPFVALLLGTGLAFLLPTKINGIVTETWVGKSIRGAAEILMITCAAGGFGAVLKATPIGNILADIILKIGLPSILVPYILSSIILIAMGSSTVAIMTSSAICAPMIVQLGLSPEMAVIAVAAGSFTGVHANSSYFWCVSKLAGFDLNKGYRTITTTSLVMGVSALASLLVMSIFFK
ncbi:MAG: GntP family permease [Clostridia bacterium]|nr:GntP family permease [Clostridia bacterium]